MFLEVIEVIKGFFILCLILIPIEMIFPLHQQKTLRKGWGTDVIYFFFGHFIGKAGLAFCAVLIAYLLKGLINPELQRLVTSQPVGLQLLEAILIADIGYYTAHRLAHTIPWLWKFHAVHHSIETMDWLAAIRVHPFDQIFTKTFQLIPLYLLGFSKEIFAFFFLFGAFEAFFIHSNLRFRYGWLRWIISTPQFHHWHHSADTRAFDKNFAAQLPILDLIFGTLYMPGGKLPDSYGIVDPVPSQFIGQMIYPFRRKA